MTLLSEKSEKILIRVTRLPGKNAVSTAVVSQHNTCYHVVMTDLSKKTIYLTISKIANRALVKLGETW